ncbi:MAG: hypothetical protein FWF52_08405 [Candidatus Azobacteroides sp.]|nr:hypothetical protein [Candidatus Azobacteroides sp.]
MASIFALDVFTLVISIPQFGIHLLVIFERTAQATSLIAVWSPILSK